MEVKEALKRLIPADGGEKGWKRYRPLLIVLLLLVAAIIALLVWQANRNPYSQRLEPNAVVGMMPGKTDEQIQEELNRQVDEKTIAFTINATPSFAGADAKGDILFENPESNNKLVRLEIIRDDTGETIYSTGLMRAGTYVAEDALDVRVAPGAYACTAFVYGYRSEDETYIGKVAAGVKVTVLN